jgi:hypothetical protein
MTRTLLPELHSPATRQALAEAILSVLDGWGIHPAKQAELLGMTDVASLKQGQALPDDPGVLERAGHLLAIERALKQLYPDDPASRHASLMLPLAELGGQPPLLVMLGGVDGIKQVRALLESPRRTDRE